MHLVSLVALLCGQLPTPQGAAAAPPSAPPQTLVLLQYAPAPTTTAPSVLVVSPPFWDRAMAAVGQALVDRSRRHQHARPAMLFTPVQASVAVQPAMLAAVPTAPAMLRPAAAGSPQNESVPPPPMIYIPDPAPPRRP